MASFSGSRRACRYVKWLVRSYWIALEAGARVYATKFIVVRVKRRAPNARGPRQVKRGYCLLQARGKAAILTVNLMELANPSYDG